MGRRPVPKPSFLDLCEYLGFIHGERRWRSQDRKRIYTWDELHGEIEVYNARGRHIGVLHPVTGLPIKDAVAGRRIDV